MVADGGLAQTLQTSFVGLMTRVEATRHLIFIAVMIVVGLLIARFVHRKLRRPPIVLQ